METTPVQHFTKHWQTVKCMGIWHKQPNGRYIEDKELSFCWRHTFQVADRSNWQMTSTPSIIMAHQVEQTGRLPRNCLLPRGLSGLLNLFSPSKLSGVDGISPILLQKCQKEIILHLVTIARSCLLFGYIPGKWRRARAVFTSKVGAEMSLFFI